MPIRHAIVLVLGAALLLASRRADAALQEPLGMDCPAQVENDARVRALFAPLLGRLSDVVGKTVGCTADAPDGGIVQRTAHGLLYARPENGGPVRIIVFTDGLRHWAVDANLVQTTLYWEGDAPYPPAQSVQRIPAPSAAQTAPWPPSPAPTVGPGPAPSTAASRPETGENLGPATYGGGQGELTFKNGMPLDAAFKLRDVDGARAARAFVYVRTSEQVKLEGVRPGTYVLQTIVGRDWDVEAHSFHQTVWIAQFKDEMRFDETTTDEGVQFRTASVTIFPTTGGDPGGTQIDLAEFQQD